MRIHFKQTYTNLEILLVNDGSTDNSGELCDQLAQRSTDSCHSQRKTVAYLTLEIEVEEASSDLIRFISDDYIDEDMYGLPSNVRIPMQIFLCGHYDVITKFRKAGCNDSDLRLNPKKPLKRL